MTKKDTLDYLKNIRGEKVVGFADKVSISAIISAIEALEKQIPKRPYTYDGYEYEGKGEDLFPCFCPVCEKGFAWRSENYCQKCGQKFDWSVL